jgi:hypothetical protein
MNKKYFLIMLCIYLVSSNVFGQLKIDTTKRYIDTTVTIHLADFINADKQLTLYADTLNNLKRTDKLPKFLYNPCFDNQPILWTNLHSAVSLRNMLLGKVENKEVLKRIMNDKELSKKCQIITDIKIPYIDKSFSQLSKERLKKIYKATH